MAGDVPSLNVEVLVQLSNLTAAVQEATAGLNKIGNKAVEVSEKSSLSFHKLKDVMLGVFGGNLLTSGIMGFEKTLEEMNLAVQDAQVESERLSTALKNSGNATAANTALVEENVKSYANLGFTHAQASQAMGTLITATGNVAESTKLMGMAADLARYKHEDLNTAATTLARGTQGSVKAFKELGITLDSTLPKNEAIAKAFDQLNSKIGGQATAYTKSFAGEIAVLKERFNELAVNVGNVVFPIVSKIIDAFTKLMDIIKPFGGDLLALAGAIAGAVAAFKAYEAVVKGVTIVQEFYMVTMSLLKGAKLADVVATDAQTASMKALNFVINQNPFMKIVEVVTIVVGVMYELWKHNNAVRNIMISMAEAGIKAVGFLIQIFGDFAKFVLEVESGPLRIFLKGLSFLKVPGAKTALDDINGAIKAVGNTFDSVATKVYNYSNELDKLRKPTSTYGLQKAGESTDTSGKIVGSVPGGDTVKGAAKAAVAAQKALEARNAKIKTLNDEVVKLNDDMNAVLLDRENKRADAQKILDDKNLAAQVKYDDSVAAIRQTFTDKMQAAQEANDSAIEQAKITQEQNKLNIEQQFADKALQLQKTANDKRAAIIQQSIDLMKNAFESATKIDLGALFQQGAGSTLQSVTNFANGIVASVYGAATGAAEKLKDSLQSKLKDIQVLQEDAGKLASAGYSQSFIDEVIAQGPKQGDALAQAVLTGTPETQSAIKSLYGQINSISQNGVTDLATKMNDGVHFANQKLATQFQEVAKQLDSDLKDNSIALQTSLDKETDKFNASLVKAQAALDKATDAATNARDIALNKAQDTLTASLTAAQNAFDASIKSISESTMKQLDALQAKIEATTKKITSLGGTVTSVGTNITPAPYTPTPYTPAVQLSDATDYSKASYAVNTSTLAGVNKASVSISAPITVNGSTSAIDIQHKILQLTKYGIL